MVVATFGSILFNANLPISISLVWITNPVTMPFLFTLAYKVGAYCLNISIENFKIEASFDFFSHILSDVFPAILLGCLLIGTSGAIIGLLSIRFIWRLLVLKKWKKR